MSTVLKLAWRSIWRNRRRTLISMSAAAVGLMLVMIYSGLIAGMLGDAKNQLGTSAMGHVEITAAGWRAKGQPSMAIADPDALIARLRLPAGSSVGHRVIARGLLTSARGSESAEVHGVDWASERRLAAYLDDVRSGALPAVDDARGILIGEEMAKRLKVEVGSKVRLMSQRADGEMGADLFRVRGIFHSASAAISQRRVLISASSARTFLGLGNVSHQLVIQLADASDADLLAATIGAALGKDYETVSYRQLLPILKTLEDLIRNVVFAAALFIYLLVGLGILNTSLMSVLERTREFGVMLALGTRPRRIISLVLAESFWIATLSVAAGGALGLFVTWWGSGHALIDFSKSIGESIDLGGAVVKAAFHTRFSLADALEATGFVYVMALFVGLYPAWRVSKLQPAEALRHT